MSRLFTPLTLGGVTLANRIAVLGAEIACPPQYQRSQQKLWLGAALAPSRRAA